MVLRSRRRSLEGFTLIEMMTVVVIVGVLATLSVYGIRKYILSAKSSEAVTLIGSIKTAEEAFKDETFVYLDVSSSFGAGNFYPTTTPGQNKVMWGGPGPVANIANNWRTLGVQPGGPVQFAYAVVATPPGGGVPTLPTVVRNNASFNLPSSATQWMYIAVAKADLGGRPGVNTVVMSHSLSTEIYVENEGE